MIYIRGFIGNPSENNTGGDTMAVSMNANSGYRNDFTVGENAYSTITEKPGAQNTGNFSEILSGLGTSMASKAKSSAAVTGSDQPRTVRSDSKRADVKRTDNASSKPIGSVNSSETIKPKDDVSVKPADNDSFSQSVIVISVKSASVSVSYESSSQEVDIAAESTVIGVASVDSVKMVNDVPVDDQIMLPEDDFELAVWLLAGKVDLKDIPAERLTPKFLKMLAIVAKLQKLRKEKDGENETDENDIKPEEKNVFENKLFDPTEAIKLLQAFSELIDDQTTNIVYKVLQDYLDSEAENADKVTMLDGICKALPEFPELEETLPSLVSAKESGEEPQDWIMQIVDQMIESMKAAQIEAQKEELAAPVELVPVQDGGASVSVSEEGSAAEILSGVIGDEKLTVLETAVTKGEIVEVSVKTADKDSVSAAEDLDTAQVVKLGGDYNAHKSDGQSGGESSQQSGFTVSEELEMLRIAKQKTTVKSDDFAVKVEANPVRTENPLAADAPIVFARADGTEVSVKPTEIVNQTAKLIERAVTENKEQSEYSLVLNPEEMGRITVKLIKAADGAVTVTIAAENARTQRLLETHSELMQNNLRSNGVDLESWQTVSESGQQHAAQDYQGSAKNPYYSEEHHSKSEENNSDENSFADLIAAM